MFKVRRLFFIPAVVIMLILSSCDESNNGSRYGFEAAPVDYFGYVGDSLPDCITVTGEMLTPESCRITVHNSGKKDVNLGYTYGIYKLVGNEWLPVKEKRPDIDGDMWVNSNIKKGEEQPFVFDWSYEYGDLSKGSYKLATYCVSSADGYKKRYPFSWNFDMPAPSLPEKDPNPYGYKGKASELDSLVMTAERISPHRLRLTIAGESGADYMFDRTWALYIKSGNDWAPVEPKTGQYGACYSIGYPGKYTVVFSSFYGSLKAGDYLIVKRGLPQEKVFEMDWRSRPASDFTYVSAELHLDSDLQDIDYDAEPQEWYGYIEDSQELSDISTLVENPTPYGCTLVLGNSGEKTYTLSAEDEPSYIYRLCGNEWLPVKIRGALINGLIGVNLKPGSLLRLNVNWSFMYGRLQPGTYKLIRDIYEDGKPTSTVKSFDFEITADMISYKENPFGYSSDAPIADGYILTAEPISPHRYKLTKKHIGEAKDAMNIQQSFALYTYSGSGWVPVTCKYKIDDYYYIDGDTYYGVRLHNFTGGADIIDLTALYPNLKPGNYRLVLRGESPEDFKFLFTDIEYKP